MLECSSHHLQNFKFQSLNVQVQTCAPFLYKIIDCLTKHNEILNVVIISLLLRAKNIQISRLHHIITQVLDHGGATDETINILTKLGLCVGASAGAKKKVQLQESQTKHIKDLVMDEIEQQQSDRREIQTVHIPEILQVKLSSRSWNFVSTKKYHWKSRCQGSRRCNFILQVR